MRCNKITREDTDVLHFDGSASNANNALRTLRCMLSFGKSKGYLCGDLPKIRLEEEHEREITITREMEEEALRVAPQPLRDVLMLTLDTGLRPWREIKYLRVENIDWLEGTIFNAEGKTKRSRRHVPMSDRVREILDRHCAGRASGWVFSLAEDRPGYWEITSQASMQFGKMRSELGWPENIVFYSARHTFGSDIARETGNPVAAMHAMGHTKLRTTTKYLHTQMDEIREAVNRKNERLQ